MNVYQEMIKQLQARNASREAIKYCSDYAWDFLEQFNEGRSIETLVLQCIKESTGQQ